MLWMEQSMLSKLELVYNMLKLKDDKNILGTNFKVTFNGSDGEVILQEEEESLLHGNRVKPEGLQ